MHKPSSLAKIAQQAITLEEKIRSVAKIAELGAAAAKASGFPAGQTFFQDLHDLYNVTKNISIYAHRIVRVESCIKRNFKPLFLSCILMYLLHHELTSLDKHWAAFTQEIQTLEQQNDPEKQQNAIKVLARLEQFADTHSLSQKDLKIYLKLYTHCFRLTVLP